MKSSVGRFLLASFAVCILAVAVVDAQPVPSTPSRAEAVPGDARTLVELLKPHERQAQAVRFMIAVSPFASQEGLADCTVRRLEPPLKSYFESLYAENLSREELRDAVTFFSGKKGREAVRLRLEHEQDVFAKAQKGETVEDERVKYPAEVARALDRFWKSRAGRFFVEDELEQREPHAAAVTDLRNEALAQCLKEKR